MIEGVAGAEYLAVDRTPSHSFEGDRSYEFARCAGHYHVYLSTCLCKQTRQPH
jgi:hypothetical protein